MLVASLAAAGPSADLSVVAAANTYLEVDAAGTLSVDGQDVATTEGDATVALDLAPGKHVAELISKDGRAEIDRGFVVAEGEVAVLALRLGAEPLRLDEDIMPPVALEQPAPEYPEAARSARLRGETILECVIDASGSVQVQRVLKADHQEVVPSVLEAVSSWRYQPATRGAEFVPVFLTVRLEHDFRRM
jgi:TonB family protein